MLACLLFAHNSMAARPSRCDSVVTRKEVRDLSSSEWKIVSDTIARMQELGWFTYFASLHEIYFPVVHGQSQFLPFHRRLIRHFEMVGQRINPEFALPYWNEFPDYRNPAKSKVLTDRLLGGNGQGGDKCVMDGVQANWTMHYPSDHCLRRDFDRGDAIQAWHSTEFIQSVIQRSDTMAVFRESIENSQHGMAHLGIRGDMVLRHSPNDFIFMLHHAFVDRIWAVWQDDGHESTFDGPGPNEPNMTKDSRILFFNESVESVLSLGRGLMCYEYEDPEEGSDLLAKRAGASSALAALPNDVLCRWYPQTCSEVAVAGDTSAVPRTETDGLVDPQSQLPMPAEISDDFARMHGFNVDEVRRMNAMAKQFVTEMNAAGYRPKH
ncbi:hypothetical protein IWW55_005215 [Coemansia sp. RSA 2706]|nr:hypothetical protein IWW55_005215 [Coemansia sp. RSA 2706]KAJ2302518.1 hypothetical protein IWW54_006007 [Coemansia sp. RSA 2705]KAJ2309151.1 hypothetical protein IWW52_005773 [Coemansia sp. RSA 2704]KAJ2714468.1 hypothetical protein H4R23_005773 [Coemansia sp. Cherry 401B]